MRRLYIVVLLACLSAHAFSQSTDWPCWRGPNHDGVSTETAWNPEALKGGAKVLWNVDIGTGYSNVAVAQGRIYAMGKDRKTLAFAFTCLDAETGKVIWVNQTLRVYGTLESTPAVDGDRVYGLGNDGALFCLDTATGALKWQKNIVKDYQAGAPGFGWATSPVIEGGLILVNANTAGMAIDKLTGSLAWSSPAAAWGKPGAYASPVPFGPPESGSVLFFGPEKLSAVKAATGELLWSYAHGEPLEVVADPISSGDRVWFSHHDIDEMLATGGSQVSTAWRASSLRSGVASPVMVGEYLFGQDWAAVVYNWDWETLKRVSWPFVCIDAATGAPKWSKYMKSVATSAAGGKLLVLEIDGALHIVDASPEAWREYSSADVLQGANKARLFASPPVLSGGRIYCRNYSGDLVCIDVRK